MFLANAWPGERCYTSKMIKRGSDNRRMENQKGRRHSAKEAKEAIVLLKKKEGVDIARVEIYSRVEYILVKAYDFGTGPW